MNKLSYFLIIISAALWGLVGIFVKGLYVLNLSSMEIVALRALNAALILVIFAFIKNRSLFKIKLRDIPYFIGTGLFSFVFFNWCYFIAIENTSLSTAAILLYTAPAFVMVLSWILFKEKMTRAKTISLILTFTGCVCVTGYLQNAGQRISISGLLAGLGAGFGYALYSIFGKYALKKYTPYTVTLYTFIFAGISSIPFMEFNKLLPLVLNGEVLSKSMYLGLFSTVLPFTFYTKGLSNIDSGKASIIATLEPVVAMLVSVFLFREQITFGKLLGILLVIFAILIVSYDTPDNAICREYTENSKAA